ncbi:MAG: PQQ-dependent sugar dehydrogenase [Candidatus Aminicenantes bacterium RBG_16_66_30]
MAAIRNGIRVSKVAVIPAFMLLLLILLAGASLVLGQAVKGRAAFGDWRQDKPGVMRLILPQDLPPVSTESVGRADIVPLPAGAKPLVPDGFSVELVTSRLDVPRVIRLAPNGDLFVAESGADAVRVYRIPSGSAKPARAEVFARGLRQPYGIAFYPLGPNPDWVYVANSDSVVRFPYKNGDLTATGKPEKIVERIPWTHHWTRDIVFSPDGRRMFLAVGSGSNVALDMFPEPRMKGGLAAWSQSRPLGAAWDTEERRADVLSFDADGKNEKIYATGLRNCSGMAVQPATGRLWGVINERDGLGDDTPFEYATGIQEGAFYGWPWFYIGGNEDPRHPGARPDLKDKVTVPDVLIQAHSAPLGIVFYDGDNFPEDYRGDAFVTLHGSWNREKRTGYKVIRLIFDGKGRPTGEYEDFMTGFVVSDKEVWGRPVGVAVAKDGSLFVTEDGNGTIWRVARK